MNSSAPVVFLTWLAFSSLSTPALAATPGAAVAVLDKEPNWHAMLRTTCVATMLSAGHATNALPQRARANINCRIFPGVSREEILAQLVRIADDPAVVVSIPEVRGPVAPPAPLLTSDDSGLINLQDRLQ
jgi:acetylornithine deacetylase/succinyl-diaminopimelate desuccinylase-like protein